MSKQNAHQGGWIANFLIIGAVLVLGLIGSVYFLKTRSANPEIATEDTQSSQPDSQDTAPAEEQKKPEAAKPDTTKEKKVVTPAPAGAKDLEAESSEETARDLPATGPAETSQAIVGASLLAFSASAYVQSRRTR